MKRSIVITIVVGIIAVASGLAYILIDRGFLRFDDSRITSHQSQMYHCPMHPSYISDKPGTCPICGMTLVPMEESAPHKMDRMKPEPPGRAAITVTPTQRQMIGVKTGKAAVRPLVKEIRTVGTVAFDPQLAIAQQEYLTARRLGDSTLWKAAEQRLHLMGMSREQIKQLAKRNRVQKNLYLPAPEGNAWIYAMIYEVDIPYIKEGQDIDIMVPGTTTTNLSGTISAIDPVLDPKTRAITVRSEVQDSDGLLKPNQYVDVFVKVPLGEVLSAPASAVVWSDKAHYVFVDEGKGRLVPRQVSIGQKADDFVQIVDGLEEGENVVVSPNFLFDAESQLKATLKELGGGHAH